jgi:hypothetical protein
MNSKVGKVVFVFLLFSFHKNLNAQSLLLDNIGDFVFTLDLTVVPSDISNLEALPLRKVDKNNRSEFSSKTIVLFTEDMKIISCNAIGEDSLLLASYPYHIDHTKGIVTILYAENKKVKYKGGITSVGNFGILFKTKKQ